MSKIHFMEKMQDLKMLEKGLLFCGIMSSLLYFCMDIFASLRYEGYNYLDQAISELSAIGSPTRSFWVAMTFMYCPLLIAGGIGVWMAAGRKFSLQLTGILLSVWGMLGYVWLFFPMHMRGEIGSSTDTMHLVMSGVTVFLILSFLISGAGARGRWFRIYSYITILVMLTFGAMIGRMAPSVAAQLPTPWMGVMERLCVFSPMIWVLVLAIVLLRAGKRAGPK